MTTALWCLVIVLVFPLVLAGVGGYFRVRQLGSLDNKNPRVQALELRDVAARAYAAQQNAWEALAMFSGAIIIAHVAGVEPGQLATPAVIFVVARILHAVMYIANLDLARTGVFVVGLGCMVRMLWLAGSV